MMKSERFRQKRNLVMNNLVKRTISGIVFAIVMLFAFLSNTVLIKCGVSYDAAQLAGKLIYGTVFLFALLVMMNPSLSLWERVCAHGAGYARTGVGGFPLFSALPAGKWAIAENLCGDAINQPEEVSL